MIRSRISFQQSVAIVVAVTGLWSSAVHAEEISATTVQKASALTTPVNLPREVAERRASVLSLIEREAQRHVLPFELADAVAFLESAYLESAVGKAGEIGLMQIMPSTAAMLGFAGSMTQLAEPETNIRYGVEYLAIAWRLTGGDLCRTLMKYRAGHGSDVISARSAEYCRRAREHLAALGSALADAGTLPTALPTEIYKPAYRDSSPPSRSPSAGSERPPIRGSRFWAAHRARIRTLTTQVHMKWSRIAQLNRTDAIAIRR
jgi:Transglycosylase SLT domain